MTGDRLEAVAIASPARWPRRSRLPRSRTGFIAPSCRLRLHPLEIVCD